MGVELSPRRNLLCRSLFQAQGLVKDKGVEDKVEVCTKGLRLYVKDTMVLLGETPGRSDEWKWEVEVAKEVGLGEIGQAMQE